jgi:hypothetical protein
MHIFFDMDYTLVAYDGSLRPMTHEVFDLLNREGHYLYIWSGIGVRTAEVHALGLADFTRGVFQKPVEKFDQGLLQYDIPVAPDVVVDDHKEVVSHFGGIWVRSYFWPDPGDRELERVYHDICIRHRGPGFLT